MTFNEVRNSQTMRDTLGALWLKLLDIEAVKDRSWRLPLDYLHSHLILAVTGGCVQVVVDGHHLPVEQGNAIVCLPGQLVKVSADSMGDVELYALHFDVKYNGEVPYSDHDGYARQDSIFPVSGAITLSDASWMVQTCDSAALLWHSGDSLQQFQVQGLFYSLVHRLLVDALRIDSDKDVGTVLNRTKLYMDRHYDRNITIDGLAELAGLSRFYYMRSFKSAYGISAMDYLLELRINQSKRLMEKTDIRLRDIARQVGYNDEYYFNRKFKQKVGIPPITYIKNRRHRVAAYSFPNIGQLLALRIVPHAAPMDHSWTDLYRRKYDSDVVVKLSHDYEFNLEALRQAQPDYIIGVDHFVPFEEQQKLKQLAPAFFVPWHTHNWRQHLRLTADFLGNEAEASSWLQEYEQKVVNVRKLTGHVIGSKTVIVLQMHKDKYYIYGERTIAGVLYQDLNLAAPDGVVGIDTCEEVTLHRLMELDADWILMMFMDGSNRAVNWDKLRQFEEWSSMKAVRREQVAIISPCKWFEYSAYTQDRFLSEIPGIFKVKA